MQSCYADDAVFNDEVFTDLNAEEVRAMWEMFCVKGKDMQISFSDAFANGGSGSAHWVAQYTFSATGKKVVNRIKANFTFADGKIVKHTDQFDFYQWARQALGLTGKLLGWTSFLKEKVKKEAMKNLKVYMATR